MTSLVQNSDYALDAILNVRKKGDKFSLTDLWKLAGSDINKAPAQWAKQNETQGFLTVAARFSKCDLKSLLESTKGRHGGSWGVELIALEYAQYLDPALAVLVNKAFLERIEEEVNPELAIQRGNARARKVWANVGKGEKWIEARIKGVATRKHFTDTLASHGVERDGYRNCTNAVYIGLYGGSTDVVRHKKHLEKGVSIRDNMDEVELAATQFAEVLALDKIKKQDLRGNAQCEMACTSASKAAANAIMQSRKA